VPKARLIEKHEVKKAARRRSGDNVQKQRDEARQWMMDARESGKAVELTLDPKERDETVKNRYRLVAKSEGWKLRFHTSSRRSHTNRKGIEKFEADVLIVVVQ
jgi:leucyl-tRNA synthetase